MAPSPGPRFCHGFSSKPVQRILTNGSQAMQTRTPKEFARLVGIGILAVALLTVVCYRMPIDFASAIPLYMLVVVVHSLVGDFRSSAIIAALSAGCLDFFLPSPCFRCPSEIRAIVLPWGSSFLQLSSLPDWYPGYTKKLSLRSFKRTGSIVFTDCRSNFLRWNRKR